MTRKSRETASLATLEACNALKAERFSKLPEEIPLWRFREVLLRLRKYLGLSDGAVTYALDLMGLLTEADWRGDGRPVTYHSIRSYARKVEKCERTIGNYETQLIAAGLVHRTVKHARRHGGQGNDLRRTGLDWRAFGFELPGLLERLDARNRHNERCLDIEARIRSERRVIMGLADALEEGRAAEIAAELHRLGASPLRACLCIAELEPILAALTMARVALAEEIAPTDATEPPVDNPPFSRQESEQSESFCSLIDTTEYPPCPMDIRNRPAAAPPPPAKDITKDTGIDAIPLTDIWSAAPSRWKMALGDEIDMSWPLLIDVASRIAQQLGVSPYAWTGALRVMGPSQAALALMVLDRNRTHPVRPVHSVGGALVGMTRRAQAGDFNLAASVYGIMSRKPGDDPHPYGETGQGTWQNPQLAEKAKKYSRLSDSRPESTA